MGYPKQDMTLNEYQQAAARTLPQDQTDREALHMLSMGLAGETGEVVDLMKKVLHHGKDLSDEELCLELGDVLFYLSAIARRRNMTLEQVARGNIEKLTKRFPDGWSPEVSRRKADRT